MRKQILISALAITFLSTIMLISSCTKPANPTPAPNPIVNSNLALNTWTVDGKLFTMSAFGSGWASTNFASRFGLTDYTTTNPVTQSIEINFLQAPNTTKDYTIDQYSKVHLEQITGDFVGLTVRYNDKTYQSISTSGKANITVNGKENVIILKDVLLQELLTTSTIKVSAHIKAVWP
jgi:hypothetical protein